ncbi:TPA: GNAT family N-acetyltransferase [Salmonella bongori]|uniref:N-acetyltransferase domain-containing protein n=1 Tax=Salmonella bongori N268-08 TaxID=1197719 RepID=S5MYL3_SALBN|nr:GNAT family N-acetyltransferase [Salmonella bongori]AGR59694.1 hypothetical protein A464_2509 [Salmonella bongori N268-08]ECC8733242.1 GNAT family N-acetyltransferase [Salmonella bongori]ECE6547217.1 GNAT family N-acetyltransferase [Salmonella bongori]ECI3518734.1 GNAT family N-acetyltransferase [Salmonella bongori]EDP8575423.1 GNAT family N-acetyltransferase [Salmonella bongori]
MALTIGCAGELGLKVHDLCNFYNENWPRKIALGEEDFYKWQFINTPYNNGLDECCVAVDGDEIIGIMGLNSRSFYANNRKLSGAELTTWVVAEEHRNKGSGPAIIDFLKNRFNVMTGMGISAQALPVYLRSGFRYVKAIPRHVHVINWDNIGNYIESTPLAAKYARSQVVLSNYTSSTTDEHLLDRIYSEFSEKHFSFSRFSKDVKWRYDDHPYFNYHHFIVNSDCHVAVRIDNGIDGFVMAHCVDIVGNKESYHAAISAAIEYAKENGADAIDFFFTNASINARLDAMGLFSTLDHEFFKFPHLFHPVEIRTPATTSLILWSRDNMDDMLDMSLLHVTKQDADFDRPTIQGMKK